MVPDQNGTTVSFADSDTVTLNLSFTMGGWPLSHVEFVGFLQNPGTKEVLQAMKVNALWLSPPPMAPEADFEAETTQSCEGYEVHFTDLSTQNPTQWAWTFPGGTPETSTEQNPVVVYAEEGVYGVSLEATNMTGTGEITKDDYMDIAFTPDQPVISLVDFTLESSALEGNQWYMDGQIIEGATEQSYEPMTNGTYSVTATDGNCTSDFAEDYPVMWVGIAEQFNQQAIKVYPTPSKGNFTLEINTQTADVLSMKVYDAMKSVVYQQDNLQVNGSMKNQINLEQLPNGIYFIVLEGNTTHYFQKIIIQK
jgi:PKD repeat protein